MADLLNNAGYDAKNISKDLKEVYDVGSKTLGNALKKPFDLGKKDMAKVLKAAGFGLGDTARFLKNQMGAGFNSSLDALKSAGFSNVKKWLTKNLF